MSESTDNLLLADGYEPGHVALLVHPEIAETDGMPTVNYDLLTSLYDQLDLRGLIDGVVAAPVKKERYNAETRRAIVPMKTSKSFMQEAIRANVATQYDHGNLSETREARRKDELMTYQAMGAMTVGSIVAGQLPTFLSSVATGLGYYLWYQSREVQRFHSEVRVQRTIYLPRYAGAVVFPSEATTNSHE